MAPFLLARSFHSPTIKDHIIMLVSTIIITIIIIIIPSNAREAHARPLCDLSANTGKCPHRRQADAMCVHPTPAVSLGNMNTPSDCVAEVVSKCPTDTFLYHSGDPNSLTGPGPCYCCSEDADFFEKNQVSARYSYYDVALCMPFSAEGYHFSDCHIEENLLFEPSADGSQRLSLTFDNVTMSGDHAGIVVYAPDRVENVDVLVTGGSVLESLRSAVTVEADLIKNVNITVTGADTRLTADGGTAPSEFIGAAAFYAHVVADSSVTVSDGATVTAASYADYVFPSGWEGMGYLSDYHHFTVAAAAVVTRRQTKSSEPGVIFSNLRAFDAVITAVGPRAAALGMVTQSTFEYDVIDIRAERSTITARHASAESRLPCVAAVAGIGIPNYGNPTTTPIYPRVYNLTISLVNSTCSAQMDAHKNTVDRPVDGAVVATVGGVAFEVSELWFFQLGYSSFSAENSQISTSAHSPDSFVAVAASLGIAFATVQFPARHITVSNLNIHARGTTTIKTEAAGVSGNAYTEAVSAAASGGIAVAVANLALQYGNGLDIYLYHARMVASDSVSVATRSTSVAATFGLASFVFVDESGLGVAERLQGFYSEVRFTTIDISGAADLSAMVDTQRMLPDGDDGTSLVSDGSARRMGAAAVTAGFAVTRSGFAGDDNEPNHVAAINLSVTLADSCIVAATVRKSMRDAAAAAGGIALSVNGVLRLVKVDVQGLSVDASGSSVVSSSCWHEHGACTSASSGVAFASPRMTLKTTGINLTASGTSVRKAESISGPSRGPVKRSTAVSSAHGLAVSYQDPTELVGMSYATSTDLIDFGPTDKRVDVSWAVGDVHIYSADAASSTAESVMGQEKGQLVVAASAIALDAAATAKENSALYSVKMTHAGADQESGRRRSQRQQQETLDIELVAGDNTVIGVKAEAQNTGCFASVLGHQVSPGADDVLSAVNMPPPAAGSEVSVEVSGAAHFGLATQTVCSPGYKASGAGCSRCDVYSAETYSGLFECAVAQCKTGYVPSTDGGSRCVPCLKQTSDGFQCAPCPVDALIESLGQQAGCVVDRCVVDYKPSWSDPSKCEPCVKETSDGWTCLRCPSEPKALEYVDTAGCNVSKCRTDYRPSVSDAAHCEPCVKQTSDGVTCLPCPEDANAVEYVERAGCRIATCGVGYRVSSNETACEACGVEEAVKYSAEMKFECAVAQCAKGYRVSDSTAECVAEEKRPSGGGVGGDSQNNDGVATAEPTEEPTGEPAEQEEEQEINGPVVAASAVVAVAATVVIVGTAATAVQATVFAGVGAAVGTKVATVAATGGAVAGTATTAAAGTAGGAAAGAKTIAAITSASGLVSVASASGFVAVRRGKRGSKSSNSTSSSSMSRSRSIDKQYEANLEDPLSASVKAAPPVVLPPPPPMQPTDGRWSTLDADHEAAVRVFEGIKGHSRMALPLPPRYARLYVNKFLESEDTPGWLVRDHASLSPEAQKELTTMLTQCEGTQQDRSRNTERASTQKRMKQTKPKVERVVFHSNAAVEGSCGSGSEYEFGAFKSVRSISATEGNGPLRVGAALSTGEYRGVGSEPASVFKSSSSFFSTQDELDL